MRSYICLCVIFVEFLQLTSANLTTCEKSQQHFADMCFSPSASKKIDHAWMQANQPAEGWYHNIGNDVTQFHFSEIIKKKVLNRTDDFSELCTRVIIDHASGGGDGQLIGYGGQVSNWVCNSSMDFPGIRRCDLQIDHSKFHEDFIVYMNHQDDKTKIAFAIYCFPNGQVGWATLSKHPKLTDVEHKMAISQAESLGFPKDTHEILYGDKCPQ